MKMPPSQLLTLLQRIQVEHLNFSDGLSAAINEVTDAGGRAHVSVIDGVNTTTLTLAGDTAYCFKPYPAVDLFYFEL